MLVKGSALHRSGNFAAAATVYREILSRRPRHAEALNLLGLVEYQRGRPTDAVVLLQKSLKLAPRNANAYQVLGEALRACGTPKKAINPLRKSLKLDPSNIQTLTLLGRTLAEADDYAGAFKAFEKIVKLKPNYAAGWYHFGLLHMRYGDSAAEIKSYRKAIEADPVFAPALHNLSVALRNIRQMKEAIECAESSIAAQPSFSNGYIALMDAHFLRGDSRAAIEAGRRGLENAPNDLELVAKVAFLSNYDEDAVDAGSAEAHFKWGRFVATSRHERQRPCTDETTLDRPLRIGYVSPDFRRHSVAYYFEPLLTHHDPASVTTYCYANVVKPDEVTERLRGQAGHWRDIYQKDDKTVAAMVREDKIDILIDLAGHTAGHRLGVFYLKPAPVQVGYLGYCNTTGLQEMDYRLTDPTADPPGEEAFHTESLIRLDRCFLAYRPPSDIPPVTPPPALENGYVTFGCFNHLAKMTDAVVRLWSRILGATEGSRLILKHNALDDAETADQIAARFAACGIPRDRLELLGHYKEQDSHLAAYRRIDIALDPFPYNGTTTTCEALWMGVPVIALAGKRHRSRVGLTLLNAAGLDRFIANSADDYISQATALAADVDKLDSLRANQRDLLFASSLADVEHHARCIEDAYRSMWHQWCASTEAQAAGAG